MRARYHLFVADIVIAAFNVINVSANLHQRAYCGKYEVKWLGEFSGTDPINDATIAACGAYNQRNTGQEQWDTCPDCQIYECSDCVKVHGALTKICYSEGRHIGGNEFKAYCRMNGARVSVMVD